MLICRETLWQLGVETWYYYGGIYAQLH
jgi:hypothetical protein